MKIRLILLILSLLAFLSTSTGGFLYYSSLKQADFEAAERQAASRAAMLQKNLTARLTEYCKPVATLAGMAELQQALRLKNAVSLQDANTILDHFQKTLQADVCYLMDIQGTTIATSNRHAANSFLGNNFAFRPYFFNAFKEAPATYLAIGITSKKRGAYFSYPVADPQTGKALGVAVIKVSIDLIENEMALDSAETLIVTAPNGIIFISSRPEWFFHTLWKLTPEAIQAIKISRQFGRGPWTTIRMDLTHPPYASDSQGNQLRVFQETIDQYPGWTMYYLKTRNAIEKNMSAPLLRMTGAIVVSLCLLVGLSALLLYGQASREIHKRRQVEHDLRRSEERYRSLYYHTPAMLHSVDPEGHLLSVSDYWTEALGYERKEIVGKKLTSIMTNASCRYAQDVIFPEFFKTGYCKNIPYQYLKKNGETIDILLSAITERDAAGQILRTLAVSVDVTEQKKAEKALKQARDELSQYTRDLEQLVRKRTGEITSFMKFTPAVIYIITDTEGHYSLINNRFEQLFGVRCENIRGLSHHDILPSRVADQFHRNDQNVLKEKRPCQVSEEIPQTDGMHTYLSMKFPIYDENGVISGLCSIATDVTELNKAQEQLRRLSAAVMDNQEKERSALARELHDELGQVLTALRMDAVWLTDHLKVSAPKAALRALTMCNLIDKTIVDVKGLAIRLRPGVLDDLGLVDALEWFTSDFEMRYGITCVFKHLDVPAVGNTIATAAYRITQEALTNIARHAKAHCVKVRLWTDKKGLQLNVVDDGCGFREQDMTEEACLGIVGMRERANLVGGELQIQSRPDNGTRVQFTVPLTIMDGRSI
jgi:PAS domain S-box-containing protein